MTTYKIQIRCEDGTYATSKTANSKAAAERKAKDAAAAGYSGRIVTGKGSVVNTWTVNN